MQKYKLDEVVIRRSEGKFIHLDGEYKIVGVISREQFNQLYNSKVLHFSCVSEWAYELEGFNAKSVTLVESIVGHHSSECYLFKRQDKSDYSFDQLVKELNSPIAMPCLIE